jgi:hypothetical protein
MIEYDYIENIDHQKKLIFVHIPRTGGTSISSVLSNNEKSALNIHPLNKNFLSNSLSNYFKFTSIRNPFDRLVSVYHYCIRENFSIVYSKTNNGIIFGKKNEMLSFEEFVFEVQNYKNSTSFYNYHKKFFILYPLSYWLYKNDKICVDYIIRFENINEGWEYISKKFNLDRNLPKFNETKRDDYKSYYNSSTKKIVEEFYKDDLNNFNYTF